MRLAILSTLIGVIGASAVFAVCEVVAHSGHNPFAASVEASSPALTTDRAGMGHTE